MRHQATTIGAVGKGGDRSGMELRKAQLDGRVAGSAEFADLTACNKVRKGTTQSTAGWKS